MSNPANLWPGSLKYQPIWFRRLVRYSEHRNERKAVFNR